ncbi:methyltransferase [Corynebacterium suranareeae]|uniref:Methyltransferase n=1 Tax=Corynebacterium suranareeae TaxID=2506452 RepID=A0A160PT07_9CORY|nr:methyltransferase domain-containing protein [Corynebacterium suranareeae]BAU96896.1 methyltransferase [Corynebacterium suranareeae]
MPRNDHIKGSTLNSINTWNHNNAYHPWLLKKLGNKRSLLDVGSGDHTFTSLAAAQVPGRRVTVVDPLINTTFEKFQSAQSYDAITFIASLHHMETTSALRKADDRLNPGGKLLIVGLSKNKTPLDWFIATIQSLFARPIGLMFKEEKNYKFPTKEPTESFKESTRS